MFRTVTTALAFCAAALAQAPASPALQAQPSPTFEVASIKPAAPQEMGRMMVGMRGGPGTPDPTQATFTNVSLTMLVQIANDVRDFQVTAAAWMDTTRFDIVAKVPAGATREDFRAMLRNLLAERFKLASHKETKEASIYALIVGKNGSKLKESSKEAPPSDGGDTSGGGRIAMGPPQRDKDGFPMLRGGRGNMMLMGPNGRLQMVGGHATMAQLAGNLSGQLGRPVIDMTGLTGEYDYRVEFTREGLVGPRGMPAPPPGMMPPAAEGGESGPSIFTALQEQLGLKLESRKGPVDLIVVDSAEKTPTEN
jgi:uncharacterized protein (TIGR03435 family)